MGGTIALYEYMWTGVKVLQCCLSTAMCVCVLQCELIVQSTRSLGSHSRTPWQKRLTTFSTGFSMDFACGKMAGKVANGGHVTSTVISMNWLQSTQIAIVWPWSAVMTKTFRTGCKHHSLSIITTSNGHWMSDHQMRITCTCILPVISVQNEVTVSLYSILSFLYLRG